MGHIGQQTQKLWNNNTMINYYNFSLNEWQLNLVNGYRIKL